MRRFKICKFDSFIEYVQTKNLFQTTGGFSSFNISRDVHEPIVSEIYRCVWKTLIFQYRYSSASDSSFFTYLH